MLFFIASTRVNEREEVRQDNVQEAIFQFKDTIKHELY